MIQKAQSLTNKYSFWTNKHFLTYKYKIERLPAKVNFKELGFSVVYPGKPTLRKNSIKIRNSKNDLEQMCSLSHSFGKTSQK